MSGARPSDPNEAELAAWLGGQPRWTGPILAFRAALRVLPLAQAPVRLADDLWARREAMAVLRDLILAEALLSLPRPLPPYPPLGPDSPPPDPVLVLAHTLVREVEAHCDRGLAVPAQQADGPGWAACWAGSAATSAAASAAAAVGLGAWTDPVVPAVQAARDAACAAGAMHVPWYPKRDEELLGKVWSPTVLRHQQKRLGAEAPAKAETAAAAQWAAVQGDSDGLAGGGRLPAWSLTDPDLARAEAAMGTGWAGPEGAFWRRWWQGQTSGAALPAEVLRVVAQLPADLWMDGLAELAPHLPQVPD